MRNCSFVVAGMARSIAKISLGLGLAACVPVAGANAATIAETHRCRDILRSTGDDTYCRKLVLKMQIEEGSGTAPCPTGYSFNPMDFYMLCVRVPHAAQTARPWCADHPGATIPNAGGARCSGD